MLTQEVQSKPRGTFSRACGPGRRAAHPRDLPRGWSLRHPGRAEGHRAAEQPRRPGIRGHRGPEDHGQAHHLRRQPGFLRRSSVRRDQDRRDRASSASSRATTSTTATASRPTASCCGASTSRAAMPTSGSCRRLTEFDPEARGFVVTFTIEEGDLYRFGTVDVVSTVRDVDPGALRARLKMRSGGDVQCRAGGEDGRGHDRRDVEARLCFRAGAPARRPRLADAHHQRRLRGRAGRARLHRAPQYPRQYTHPRLCHPARVRDRRGRRLQPHPDRSGRAALEEPELLQDRAHHQRARLGARPHRHQCRGRGAVDRRILDLPAAIRPRRASWPRSASPSATCSGAGNTPRPPSSTASMPAASSSPSPSHTSSTTAFCWASTSSTKQTLQTNYQSYDIEDARRRSAPWPAAARGPEHHAALFGL